MSDNLELDSSLEKFVDERHPRIYLVWSMNESGVVSLRAICSTQAQARVYRIAIAQHARIVRAWIETTIMNHLFGEGDIEKNYPSIKPWDIDEKGNLKTTGIADADYVSRKYGKQRDGD